MVVRLYWGSLGVCLFYSTVQVEVVTDPKALIANQHLELDFKYYKSTKKLKMSDRGEFSYEFHDIKRHRLALVNYKAIVAFIF